MFQPNYLLFVSCCLLLSIQAAAEPGFQVRITKRGLDYVNENAVKTLVAELPAKNIPDQSERSGSLEYTLSQIRIPSIQVPSSEVTLVPGNGLRWSASNVGLSVQANWRVRTTGWIKVSTSGSVGATLSGIDFGITINVGQDANGRPSISSAGCQSNIRSVSLNIHGSLAFVLNLFKGLLERKVKSIIPGLLCDQVTKLVNVNAQTEIQKLKVTIPLLGNRFLLDYRLIMPPAFTSLYLQTYHKGEITWAANPSSPPFSPQPIPSSEDSSKMAYLWISEYLPQSLAYAAQSNGFLRYNLTGQDLQPGNKTFLDATCNGLSFCIGELFPAIANKYPNSKVEMQMSSSQIPTVQMRPDSLGASFTGNIDFYAHTPSGQGASLFTLNVSVSMDFSASLSNDMIMGKILSTRINVGVQSSVIGPLDASNINTVVQSAMELFIVPQLNEVGSRGFPLPKVDNIKFVNSELRILQGALMVATDVQYGV
ncbi:bactericidal permeability-increasing protein-like [Pomacea canaliculata]|uniref:bactericidal permeability-increasing protein-like n=1 Tax=Pomacea canaliculata TaxID=400727 RepID=UPI000D735400|nr:bactericidal permeability-increasing protein-like [Pomacea canaliculata]